MFTSSYHPAKQKNVATGNSTNVFFQPKLTINQPNDVYEQEADAMADKVMRMSNGASDSSLFFKPAISSVQRKCGHCEEEQQLQRKATDNQTATAEHELTNYISGLSGRGQSLPDEARSFFEPRFGRNFSDVKVHTDTVAAKSAQSINALAYTTGNNVVFNSGQYSPGTDSGKRLLGHELTHVVQQAGDANKIQRTRVTSGEYGIELENFTTLFTVPSLVTTLLTRSPIYMNMARNLDTHYIALDGRNILSDWAAVWNPDTDGVLRQGPFRSRRVLAVWYGSSGSEFLPAGSLDNDFGYDIILLKPPDALAGDQTIGEWIQIIAHETAHAFSRINSTSTLAPTALARITAAITDEVNTRATETRIVTQATRGGRLPDYSSTTGSTNPAEVQRDMFPSSLKRTYLEQFVFDELVRKAIIDENLSQADIETHNTRVDRLAVSDIDGVVRSPGFILYFDPSIGLYNTFDSKYDELRYVQRVINARWTRHEQRSAGNLDAKEMILQEHATAFFQGIASYSPRP